MKTNLILTLVLFFLMIFFPFLTLLNDNTSSDKENSLTTALQTESENTTEAQKKEVIETVEVFLTSSEKTEKLALEKYLYLTVAAEMPASFHEEALKAQAVASYSYLKWIKENADNPSAFKSDITSDSSKHQAVSDENELKEKWGSSYDIYSKKIKDAVKSVLYEYVSYKNETAMTVFHSLSAGNTASSEDIWGSPLPYLSKVTAPGDKLSPDYTDEITVNENDFLSLFKCTDADMTERIIKSIRETSDGFVKEISFEKTTLTAAELRSSLSLKSPFFTVKKDGDRILFTVYGKGHGVGMSQNSADYMARQGHTYKEILTHFYKGTKIIKEK